jgi:hypothetical protein
VPYPLRDGERGQPRHHVDRRLEQVHPVDQLPGREHKADREDHHSHRPRREADLALDAQRFGARACVGDHQRAEHRGHARGRGDGVPAVGEVPGDGREDDALLNPIEGRVEESAEERPLPRHARVAAVERVHDRADDERHAAEDEEVAYDKHRGGEVESKAGERDRVRRQPRLDQPVARERAPLSRFHG